jgi:hypothetical protein
LYNRKLNLGQQAEERHFFKVSATGRTDVKCVLVVSFLLGLQSVA